MLDKVSETGVAEGERKAGVKEVLREGQVSEQEEGWSQGLPRLSVFLGHRHGEVIASAEGREVGAPVRSGVGWGGGDGKEPGVWGRGGVSSWHPGLEEPRSLPSPQAPRLPCGSLPVQMILKSIT